MKKFETISTKLEHSNPYWDYRVNKYRLPSGNTGDYYFVDSRGSVFVIAKTDENKILMVRQYRYLNSDFSIEFPGGGIQVDTNPMDNAFNELAEEAGVKAKSIESIGKFNPCNGMTNEICYLYYADKLEFVNAEPDESEEIEILQLTADEIENKISSNEIWDGMTLASWSLFKSSKYYGEMKWNWRFS